MFDKIEHHVETMKPGWYIMGLEEDHTHVVHNGPYIEYSAAQSDMHNFKASPNGNYIANEGGITLDELKKMEEDQHKADAILEMCKDLRKILSGIDPITGNEYPDKPHNVSGCLESYIQFMEEGMK
jgi:hypothetical protein